ncbi:MAG: hypothetical protein M1827_005726 [Pycnora praestabilis]|nr:MAG: hypothetical protein M1827_005726 [Pycnora praestabilis]
MAFTSLLLYLLVYAAILLVSSHWVAHAALAASHQDKRTLLSNLNPVQVRPQGGLRPGMVVIQLFCSSKELGHPQLEDCAVAQEQIQDDIDRLTGSNRRISALYAHEFLGVGVQDASTQYPTVDTPKIYSFGSCVINVMMLERARPEETGYANRDLSSYGHIYKAAGRIIENCVLDRGGAGFEIIGENKQMVVYIYGFGSLFDTWERLTEEISDVRSESVTTESIDLGEDSALLEKPNAFTSIEVATYPRYPQESRRGGHRSRCTSAYCGKNVDCCDGFECSFNLFSQDSTTGNLLGVASQKVLNYGFCSTMKEL